jgi:hypothetical protein
MDGDWTRTNLQRLVIPGQDNSKAVTTTAEYPSNTRTALRQLGKKKPQFGNAPTNIPVVQQGTGPFGNEWDPSRSYPSLNTHRDQGGRYCVLISGVSLLVNLQILWFINIGEHNSIVMMQFLGVGCIVTSFTGAGILDSSLQSSCSYFGNYWKYRCLPVDPEIPSAGTCSTPPNAVCCVNDCRALTNNEQLRCFKMCSEMYPNFENDLGITEVLYEKTADVKTWRQRDPAEVCQAWIWADAISLD